MLDVGCGLGFTTAVCGVLVGESGLVHGIDTVETLVNAAQMNIVQALQLAGLSAQHVNVFARNVFDLGSTWMKYDRILVGALCPDHLKSKLFSLLNPDGVMVLPMGANYLGRLTRVREGESASHDTFSVKCKTVAVYDVSLLQESRLASSLMSPAKELALGLSSKIDAASQAAMAAAAANASKENRVGSRGGREKEREKKEVFCFPPPPLELYSLNDFFFWGGRGGLFFVSNGERA